MINSQNAFVTNLIIYVLIGMRTILQIGKVSEEQRFTYRWVRSDVNMSPLETPLLVSYMQQVGFH